MSVTPRSSSSMLRPVLDFFFPHPCLACGTTESMEHPRHDLGLCEDCYRNVPLQANPACDGCGRPLASAQTPAGYRCGRCRSHPPPHDRLRIAWKYEGAAAEVIKALKFRRLDYLGETLADELLQRFPDLAARVDLVVPVPLHWRRRLTRGFNQAERIASPLARRLDLPFREGLRRRRTPPQKSLNRKARLRGLRGAFRARRPDALRDRRILLVDDVVTTGATLAAAGTALRRAGAAGIEALAVARTPEPGSPRSGQPSARRTRRE